MRMESFDHNFGKPQVLEGEKQTLLAKGSGERAETVENYRRERINYLSSLNPLPDSSEGRELIRLQSENPNN